MKAGIVVFPGILKVAFTSVDKPDADGDDEGPGTGEAETRPTVTSTEPV